MRTVGLVLIIFALAAAQILIGGARLLYSIPVVALFAVAALMVVWPERRSGKTARVGCVLAALAMAATIFARIEWSPVEYLARPDQFIILGSILVYLLTALYFDQPRERLVVLICLLLLGIIHSILGAIQFREVNQFMPFPWLQRSEMLWRASGFYISPNHFAGMIEIIALFALSLVIWGEFRGKRRVLVAYLGGLCLAGLAMSGSRGGYLSFIAGTVIFCGVSLWACRSLFPRSLVAVTVALAAGLSVLGVAIAMLMLQSESLQSRLATIIDPSDVRFRLWDSAIQQFHLNPVWGTGSGTFVIYGRLFRVPYVQKDPTFAHNDYLQMLGEFGLVCAAVFLIFLLWHFVSGIRSIPQLTHAAMERGETRNTALALNLGALSAVGAYAMHSVVDFNLHIPANAFLLAFAFGIIANPGVSTGSNLAFQRSAAVVARVLLAVAALFALFHGLRCLPGEWFAEKARVALREGRPEEARAFAAKALEHEGRNPNIYYYAGEAARQVAMRQSGPAEELREESVRMFQSGLQVFPSDVRTVTKLAQAYIDFEMFDQAEETLEQAVELDPKSTLVYAFYGLCYQRQGDFEEAENYYRIAMELDVPGINAMAWAGYKAVHEALDPIRAAKTPIPPEVVKELEELKESESTEQ